MTKQIKSASEVLDPMSTQTDPKVERPNLEEIERHANEPFRGDKLAIYVWPKEAGVFIEAEGLAQISVGASLTPKGLKRLIAVLQKESRKAKNRKP